MDYGNKTNNEIKTLIYSGKVKWKDTVFSTTLNLSMWYDGVVFISDCDCREVGTRPSCNNPKEYCPAVSEAYGEFI